MNVVYWYPPYIKPVVEKLINKGWLAHNFQILDEKELYNPTGFKHQTDTCGVTYTLNIDLNIYQFILNSHKKRVNKEQFQDSIALVLFCQMSGIVLEPAYAVYEKIGYDANEDKMKEILDDLELFYQIDSADSDSLAQYFLGNSPDYELGIINPINKGDLACELTKYSRLKEWDCMYLFMLKLAHVNADSHLSSIEKLKLYQHWMVGEFRLSLVATVFAIVFFGKKPMKKMLKFKSSQTAEQKRASITNMTWDLYIMNQYFRSWVNQGEEHELMYASGDKAFLAVLKYAVEIQNTGSLQCMKEHLSKDLLEYLDILTLNPNEYPERVYGGSEWTPNYRARLIGEYEQLLGIGTQ